MSDSKDTERRPYERREVDLMLTEVDETPAGSVRTLLGQAAEARARAVNNEQLLTPGSHVRQYEIIRELGRGGMGTVVLARDTMLGRRVALKFLTSKSEQFNARFLVEARTTAQLSHENIVIIHEVNELDGTPYMALEYLEGESLAEFLVHDRPSAQRVIEIMVPVVRALVRAHEFGIVHRDLKPDNIFITSTGQIKVLDFGIAKLLATGDETSAAAPVPEAALASMSDMHLTAQGAIVGTLPYMSPEQWGEGQIDSLSDIWAVGILLFEMLAGAHPLAPYTPHKLVYSAAHPELPMPSLASRAPDLAAELIALVDGCLQKPRATRTATALILLEGLENLLPGRRGRKLAEGDSPFPGLVAFQEADADRFFGRTRDVTRALKALRERPLLGIVGPSGVGKSSLVRAGLLPALKASGETWESVILRPGRDPLATLAKAVQPLTHSNSTSLDESIAAQEAVIARMRQQPGYLGSLLRQRASARDSQILLFVDQFEELYTLVPSADDRQAFVHSLAAIADDASSPLRLVVSMRSDFLDRVGEHPSFLEDLSQGLLFLRPPDREGLREALIQPIEMLGYSYESPGLVSEMLDSLATTPGALPLLQFAAAKLWDGRDRARKLLSEESYRSMGGVAGTLASHANEVLASLGSRQQALVRAIFQRLVTPERTRAITDIAELQQLATAPEEIDALVRHLVQSRLLVVQSRSGSDSAAVEIVHESLISQWPTLRLWLDEGQEDAAFLEQLRTAAKQWEHKGKASGLLWRGEAMEEARRFHKRYGGPLAGREHAFLDAVMAAASKSQRAKRRAVIAGFVVLSALIVAGSIALFTIRQAEKEALAAEEELSAQLEVVTQKEAARAKAAHEAAKAAQEAQAGRETIAMTREELKAALRAEEQARDRAETAKAKAEAAREVAEQAEAKTLRELRELKANGRKINHTLR